MPKPVYLMTVQEAHKEYNSLTNKIRAKYEQLNSGEFGSPGTPAFDAEACELANLLARVSELCIKLNLPTPKELYRPLFFKHWRHFSDQNSVQVGSLVRVWRMQLCSHRYVRITGLLSAPLVHVRIGDFLYVLPAITLVVDKSKKVSKATSLDWLVNSWTPKTEGFSNTNSLPSWQGRDSTLCRVFTPHSTLYKVLCKSHKHQCQQCWQT